MDNQGLAGRVRLFRPFFALVLGLRRKVYPARFKLLDFWFNLALGKRKILVIPTPVARLESLMQKIAPVTCGKELIRFGEEGDGGYLLPDDLEGVAACFSPGVGPTSKLEFELAERGIKIFMADASVEGPTAKHELFNFRKEYIGSKEGMLSLEQWIEEESPASGSDDDLILQMDIEGAEYHSLLELPEDLLKRMRIIVFEAHHLDLMWSEGFFEIAEAFFDKLTRHHLCVHIHVFNSVWPFKHKGIEIPPYMEFTFLRKDRLGDHTPTAQKTSPHPLDVPCSPSKPELPLPTCWMKK